MSGFVINVRIALLHTVCVRVVYKIELAYSVKQKNGLLHALAACLAYARYGGALCAAFIASLSSPSRPHSITEKMYYRADI